MDDRLLHAISRMMEMIQDVQLRIARIESEMSGDEILWPKKLKITVANDQGVGKRGYMLDRHAYYFDAEEKHGT